MDERLFVLLTSIPMLIRAYDRVEENHGCAGMDGVTVEDFGVNLETNLVALRKEIISGIYKPCPLMRVYIEKKSGKKRPLSIPVVRDRIAQTAAALVLTPIFDEEFEDCSYAYRAGRSVQKAVWKILEYKSQGYNWVVDADISSYFDEIDHALLLGEVGKLVSEQPVIDLIEKWTKVEVWDGAHKFRLHKGVPQGSPISPVLSNLYLDAFDEALLKKGRRLVRFADDFVILSKSRHAAEKALELTEEVLTGLKLRLNTDKTRITDFDSGFRFLGVQFIKSLAFRPQYREEEAAERAASTGGQEDYLSSPAKTSDKEAVETPSDSAMVLAFNEALTTKVEEGQEQTEETEEVWQDLKKGVVTEEEDISSGGDPLLRTLYLMEQGSVLSKEDERFIVKKHGSAVREIPAIKIDQILVFGTIHITTPTLQFCLVRGIPVILLSSRGRYYGVVEAVGPERVFLQRDQFVCAADPAFCLAVGQEIVRGKIAGSRLMLRRYERTRGGGKLKSANQAMHRLSEQISGVETLDQLRGLEGAAAVAYFGAVRSLLGPTWEFVRRQRRPPPDPVNAVLSYTYTLLFYNVYSLVRSTGLNPNVGFFHSLREGHPALVSDLMEEFRAVIADAVVWPLFLNGTLKQEDFEISAEEGIPCRILGEARKVITHAFEGKMNSAITNTRTGTRSDYRRLIAAQAHTMARAVRDRGAYTAIALK